jgi:hypothetical protein
LKNSISSGRRTSFWAVERSMVAEGWYCFGGAVDATAGRSVSSVSCTRSDRPDSMVSSYGNGVRTKTMGNSVRSVTGKLMLLRTLSFRAQPRQVTFLRHSYHFHLVGSWLDATRLTLRIIIHPQTHGLGWKGNRFY